MKQKTLNYLYSLLEEYENGFTQVDLELQNVLLKENEISEMKIQLSELEFHIKEVKKSINWVKNI